MLATSHERGTLDNIISVTLSVSSDNDVKEPLITGAELNDESVLPQHQQSRSLECSPILLSASPRTPYEE
jgi:hypothetical protein